MLCNIITHKTKLELFDNSIAGRKAAHSQRNIAKKQLLRACQSCWQIGIVFSGVCLSHCVCLYVCLSAKNSWPKIDVTRVTRTFDFERYLHWKRKLTKLSIIYYFDAILHGET